MDNYQTHYLMLTNPEQFHKFLFRIAHNRSIPTVGIGYHSFFRILPVQQRHICPKLREAARLTEIRYLCKGEVLNIIQLAETHNLSIDIVGKGKDFSAFNWDQFIHI